VFCESERQRGRAPFIVNYTCEVVGNLLIDLIRYIERFGGRGEFEWFGVLRRSLGESNDKDYTQFKGCIAFCIELVSVWCGSVDNLAMLW